MEYDRIALASAIALAKNVVNIEDRVTILENENKTNITRLNAIEAVRKMNIVQYDWNETALQLKANKTVHGYGLIAQELEQIVPEVVTHTMYEEYMGIDYTKLVPFALSAVQEVDSEVQRLKKRIEELEAKLSKYEAIN